jgi:hypothetical protein
LFAEFCDQRSQSLPTTDRRIAVLRAGLVDDGDILQVLAGEVGAEHELRRSGPVAQILRQHRRTGDVEPAGGLVDGAVGADQGREKFLGFAGAGVAAADANFLTQ